MRRYLEPNKEQYLGQNEVGKSAYLSPIAKSMHTEIIGATGVGKTESAILPMIFDSIRSGHSIIFIDPKGDHSTFRRIETMCQIAGREKSLLKIDLGSVDSSTPYNPLKIGSPTELKDKIAGSIIWTEEFYKKTAERVLLNAFLNLQASKMPTSINLISQFLNNPSGFQLNEDESNQGLQADHEELLHLIMQNQKNLTGLMADLELWTRSEIGKVLADPSSDSVLDWIQSKKVVYINLQILAFEDSAKRLGRLILQDLKTAVQRIQNIDPIHRPNTSVYIDEFASIASSGFIELLNKARSANVQLTLAHQSLGDLTAVSPSFANQILDNTNTKIIFRLDSPDTSEFFARLAGTRKSQKKTEQVNNSLFLGSSQTGLGTTRDTEEFIISPNEFRKLGRGEAFVITKIPYAMSRVKMKSINEWINVYTNNLQERGTKWNKILNWRSAQ